MKLNKSVSFDIDTLAKIEEFQRATRNYNFSHSVNILIRLGFAQWKEQLKRSKEKENNNSACETKYFT